MISITQGVRKIKTRRPRVYAGFRGEEEKNPKSFFTQTASRWRSRGTRSAVSVQIDFRFVL